MVCGTTSNAGKSTLVVALCRWLGRQGVKVAPFKAQNMALNSAVTWSGHEIGRAQYLQAEAAGVRAEVAMNPILLKPTGPGVSQVVVQGRSVGNMGVVEYHEHKPQLFEMVLESLDELRRRFDVVICEGAGSPAEINLLDHDIVNLRVAAAAQLRSVIVGDIDLGGVFAALYGTVELLPPELRATVQGFVVNRFRGDPALLLDGFDQLEELTGLPTFGVIPMLDDLRLDAEDSLALDEPPPQHDDAQLEVAAIRFPHVSNFTDLDPLAAEPEVNLRWIRRPSELGQPDLVVLPGTKATVADLDWLRSTGMARAVSGSDALVLGICGGYQMLGEQLSDGFESGVGEVAGLAMLPVVTEFGPEKVLTRMRGRALGSPVTGYQIHQGRVRPVQAVGAQGGSVWLELDAVGPEGYARGRARGTTLHGLFDSDSFRESFVAWLGAERGKEVRLGGRHLAGETLAQFDRLADAVEAHLDTRALIDAMSAGRLR